MRRGSGSAAFTGVELTGKTAGLLGLGRIGALVAQRLSAFGMRIIAYDPYVSTARAAQMGVSLVTLAELLAESDVLSVHLPKTPETLGLIGKDELALTKPGAILINAARGGLVDESALAEALHSGHLGGAGIDVYAKEPTTASPLFDAPQRRRHPAPRGEHGGGAGRPGSPLPVRYGSRCPASSSLTR